MCKYGALPLADKASARERALCACQPAVTAAVGTRRRRTDVNEDMLRRMEYQDSVAVLGDKLYAGEPGVEPAPEDSGERL